MKHIQYVLGFLALISLISCSQGGEVVTSPTSVALHINITIAGTEARVSHIEEVPQRNCGGSAETESSIERSRAIKHTIETQNGLEVNSNGQVGFAGTDIELGATVASYLGRSYGEEETVSRSVTVKAKPGTHMIHQIAQEEVWQLGTAQVTVGEDSIEVPFSFRNDFAVRLVNSFDKQDCEPAALSSASTPTLSLPVTEPTIVGLPSPTAASGEVSLDELQRLTRCGDDARTTFIREDGTTITRYGLSSELPLVFISSDPATVVFSNQTSVEYDHQFVLVVNIPDLEWVDIVDQLNNSGCVYPNGGLILAHNNAKNDFEVKAAGCNTARYYEITSSGTRTLDSINGC